MNTGRGSEANGCSLPRHQGELCLLLNWKHYTSRHHTDLYYQKSLSHQGTYVLKKKSHHSPSGFPLLDILAEPSSFLYLFIYLFIYLFFLGNSSSSLASDLGAIPSRESSLLSAVHAGSVYVLQILLTASPSLSQTLSYHSGSSTDRNLGSMLR